MQSASKQENLEMPVHALAIRFVGVDRISTLDAVGEVELVERRCRQRAVRCVELSSLRILDEDNSSIVVDVGSIDDAARIARDVSGALSNIPPVAGIRVSVGCGYASADSQAFAVDPKGELFDRARAAARWALDDQLLVVEAAATNSGATKDDPLENLRVIELTPGIAADHGVGVLHVAFNNQITNLFGAGQRIMIGRADSADIRIVDPSVSRLHGRISFESGKAYFTDLSTNGSRVINAGSEAILAKRQTVELSTSGQIVVGYANGVPIHPPIRFVISRTRSNRADRNSDDLVVELGDDFDGLTTTRVI